MDSSHYGIQQLKLSPSIQLDSSNVINNSLITSKELHDASETKKPLSKGLKLFVVQESEPPQLPLETAKKARTPMLHSAFSMKIDEMSSTLQSSGNSYNDYLRKKKIDLNNKADAEVNHYFSLNKFPLLVLTQTYFLLQINN